MKARVLCMLLVLMLLLCGTACADGGAQFRRQVKYGVMQPYENMIYHYSLSLYSGFSMMSDETVLQILERIDANQDPEDDEIYDLRIWDAPDGLYRFEVQVKEPTYATFEEELLKAPYYLQMMGGNYDESQNARMLHEGRLHATRAGTMLETAVAYDSQTVDGETVTSLFVYYDIYIGGVEYCFSISTEGGDYEAALGILNDIVQTVRIDAPKAA